MKTIKLKPYSLWLASALLFCSTSGVFAQKKTCAEYYADFDLYYKAEFTIISIIETKDSEKAYTELSKLMEHCAGFNENMYEQGEAMFQKIMQPLSIGEDRNIWVERLNQLYDSQSTHFPRLKNQNELKKILLKYNNRMISDKEAISAFDAVFKTDKSIMNTDAYSVYSTLLITDNLVDTNKSVDFLKKIDALDAAATARKEKAEQELSILENSSNLSREEQRQTKVLKNEITTFGLISRNLTTHIKTGFASCEDWVAFYKSDFEANKANTEWLEQALNRLEQQRCMNSPMFEELATLLYNAKKTTKSANYMGLVAQRKKDNKKAVTYFNEAAELEADPIAKAKLYYQIALLYQTTDKAQAGVFARKAIESNPKNINSYFLLSQLYVASKDCAKNEFEQKALYLLAAQTAKKVADIDPKYQNAAERASNDYLKNAPTKDEIKKEKMSGKTIDFGCWINQSVIVP
jgi:tetratricopeptide (TPR) repeat protein